MNNYAQLRIYLDNTYTLDLYHDINDSEYILKIALVYKDMLNKINTYLPQNRGIRPIRYKMVKCPKCNQFIMTNRKNGFKITCKTCETRFSVNPLNEEKFVNLVLGFEKEANIVCKSLKNHMGYLIVISYNCYDESIKEIKKILTLNNFIEDDDPDKAIYSILLAHFCERTADIDVKSQFVTFKYKTKFMDEEVEYNGNVERIQDVVSKIMEVTPYIHSMSIFVDSQQDDGLFTDNDMLSFSKQLANKYKLNIDFIVFSAYQSLIHGKIEDAYKTLLPALNMDPDNENIINLMKAIKEHM